MQRPLTKSSILDIWVGSEYTSDGNISQQMKVYLLAMVCKISDTAQKMKFSIKDFFSKSDQIRRKLVIWSYLLKKPLMENFIFCAVWDASINVGILFLIH